MGKGRGIFAIVSVAGAIWLVIAGCNAGTTQQAEVVDTLAIGERVTFTSGCQDCHTPGTLYGEPDMARQLSGSELGWSGPWGVSFPRNLTPDMETGIGSWTEEQIVTAIRTGMRPDGRLLNPPMPWPMYSRLTDLDAHAVAKYLKSLPPVSHRVPDIVPPGATPPLGTAALYFPPPPAWDAPKTPPAGGQ